MKNTVSATRSKSSRPGNGRPRIAASDAAGSASTFARAIVRIFNPEPAFWSRTGRQDMRMSSPSETPTLGSLKMSSQVFSGTMPALMTPCGPDRRPDFDALVRMGKHLGGAGMAGLVCCGSMGDWPAPSLRQGKGGGRRPNFDALVRMGKHLVGAGMSGLVYCGSMGDWPLLTIEQRMEGVERLTKTGLPVLLGTGAQNTEQAATLAAHAKEKGAKGLMIIPR